MAPPFFRAEIKRVVVVSSLFKPFQANVRAIAVCRQPACYVFILVFQGIVANSIASSPLKAELGATRRDTQQTSPDAHQICCDVIQTSSDAHQTCCDVIQTCPSSEILEMMLKIYNASNVIYIQRYNNNRLSYNQSKRYKLPLPNT